MQSHAKKINLSEFRLDSVPSGTKQRLHLFLDYLPDGGELKFPAVIAQGEQPGNTLLCTGAVHGDEYEGPVTIMDIFEKLDVSEMRGTFFGIPVLNGPAFAAGTREGGWDHLNLARIFPGSPTGSPSERIAHGFREYVVGQADMFVDLHAGGNRYAIKEFAGYQIRPGGAGAEAERSRNCVRT